MSLCTINMNVWEVTWSWLLQSLVSQPLVMIKNADSSLTMTFTSQCHQENPPEEVQVLSNRMGREN